MPRFCNPIAQRRASNLAAPDAADPRLRTVDASRLSITKTTTPKPIQANEELVFGRTFTDHMLSLEWTAAEGWLAPQITPYQNFSLDPATCVLHYAFEAFEGMKAYKDRNGDVRLFRPDCNMKRMNKSAARIALPTFDGAFSLNSSLHSSYLFSWKCNCECSCHSCESFDLSIRMVSHLHCSPL